MNTFDKEPIKTRNVMNVNASEVADDAERKAVLAMQATRHFVDGDDQYDQTNETLQGLAAELGAAPTMTYEDLIFVNPLHDAAYVVSDDPEVSQGEAYFYDSHRKIEYHLADGIEAIKFRDFDLAIDAMRGVVKGTVDLYRTLSPAAFSAFRPYFTGLNGYSGPSGQFTAGIPTIDLLSHGGRNITPQEKERLLTDLRRGLYPSHQSGDLEGLLTMDYPSVSMPERVRMELIRQLNDFRKVHIANVKKFAPQALNDGEPGSGGVLDVAGYLSSKLIPLSQATRTAVGLGLPGKSVADVQLAAQAAAGYDYDSFSVYGDLGDLPPYAVLHAAADKLQGSTIEHIGPMGVPVGLQHNEVIAQHAHALAEQLPGQSYVGLVRGAFLDEIGEQPASLHQLEAAIARLRAHPETETIPIYLGGFGPKLLRMAGRLAVNGVKLGGSANPELAKKARETINNPDTKLVLGAVSVIDPDRRAARRLARQEVAKYLDIVGSLDTSLSIDELESLEQFVTRFRSGDAEAYSAISDDLLDKFAVAGTPEDALTLLEKMRGVVDRFEFGTPHGLGDRASAIAYIGESVVKSGER